MNCVLSTKDGHLFLTAAMRGTALAASRRHCAPEGMKALAIGGAADHVPQARTAPMASRLMRPMTAGSTTNGRWRPVDESAAAVRQPRATDGAWEARWNGDSRVRFERIRN